MSRNYVERPVSPLTVYKLQKLVKQLLETVVAGDALTLMADYFASEAKMIASSNPEGVAISLHLEKRLRKYAREIYNNEIH